MKQRCFSSPQVHITCEVSTTVCSHGLQQKAGRSLALNLPIPRKRVWQVCIACCYGNSPIFGERLCCTTRCITPLAWASASSSVTLHASSRTQMSAGNTAWEPRGGRRTPHSLVNEHTQSVKYSPVQPFYFCEICFWWHCHRGATSGTVLCCADVLPAVMWGCF